MRWWTHRSMVGRVDTCWFCRRPATGTDYLTCNRTGTRAAIPVCVKGEGCQDGRVFHGPLAAPHWPGEQCSYCEKHGELFMDVCAGRLPSRAQLTVLLTGVRNGGSLAFYSVRGDVLARMQSYGWVTARKRITSDGVAAARRAAPELTEQAERYHAAQSLPAAERAQHRWAMPEGGSIAS